MSVVRRHQPSAPSHRSQNAAKMPQKTDPGTRAPFRVQPNAAPLKHWWHQRGSRRGRTEICYRRLGCGP